MYLLMPARAFRRKHESTPGKRDEKFARKTAGEERRAYREGTREKEGEREGERVYDVTERMKSVGKSHDARYNAGVNLRTCQRRGVKARSP